MCARLARSAARAPPAARSICAIGSRYRAMKQAAKLALCASTVASAGASSGSDAVDLDAHARQGASSLCQEMQQQMSPHLTDAEFINAWLARTWEDPRVYSPVNRPAMAQSARLRPQGVPRCSTDTPRDVVRARLKLQQIHGIDEKRQYYEADGSLTFRCARIFTYAVAEDSCSVP